MDIPIITAHDPGCKFAREANGGHSDAARRVSDTYNLHKSMGMRGGFIAVSFADGSSDDTIYPSRAEAIAHQHHNERWFAYIELLAPFMTVCDAASTLRWQLQATKLAPVDRDDSSGGFIVIPRLSTQDRERQFAAMNGRLGLPVALGKRK